MTDINKRDKLQQRAVEKLIKNKKSTFLYGTGVGKTKIAVDVIKRVYKEGMVIVIAVPENKLKENTWKNEFDKWGIGELFNKVTIECYQTLYKWKNKKIDLFIADEIDFSLTEKYSKVYFNNDIEYLLGISATINGKEKQELITKIAPIEDEYSTVKASKSGFINKSRFTVIYYDLLDIPVEVKYKDRKTKAEKSFETNEIEYYKYWDNSFNKTKTQLSNIGLTKVGTNVYNLLKNPTVSNSTKSILRKHAYSMRKRVDILKNLKSSQIIAKLLIKHIREGKYPLNIQKDSRFLVFSESIEHISNICKYSIHSKQSDDENNKILENFNNSSINVLGLCKSLGRGANFDNVNVAIYASYYSSETNAQQRAGRLHRLKKDEIGYNIILVPRNTQMEKWANNMLSSEQEVTDKLTYNKDKILFEK